jgi:hypothetical protein
MQMRRSWLCKSDVLLLFIFLLWTFGLAQRLMGPISIVMLRKLLGTGQHTVKCEQSRATKCA